jgi:hypothetical protein
MKKIIFVLIAMIFVVSSAYGAGTSWFGTRELTPDGNASHFYSGAGTWIAASGGGGSSYPTTTYMADGNYTSMTRAMMVMGSVFDNGAWTGDHTITLIDCNATTANAETTFMVTSTNTMHIVSPDSKAFDSTDLTAGKALNSTETLGDFYKMRCMLNSATGLYVWRMLGQLGNWTGVTR